MILDLHGEPLVVRIERRAFGNGPRFQHTVHFQAKVIVQARCPMALHDEAVPGFLLDLRGGSGVASKRRFRLYSSSDMGIIVGEAVY